MQKKLIVAAVAGALGVPALAMAAASTVQIYGKITTEYGYADQGANRPNTDIFQTPGGSNVGFKGQEKLGGGLSAWFQCESSADVRGLGQSGWCGRNSAIGFKGSFGNLHFGRWDTPFKRASTMGSATFDNSTGLLGGTFITYGLATGTIAPNGRNRWRRREAKMIYYESPKFSGFQILAGYSAANNATGATNTTTAAKPRVVSLGALYANGPLKVGVGYERHNQFAAVGGSNDDRAWTISGSYVFARQFKVGGAYIDQKYETGPGQHLTKKNWSVSADWHISGPHHIQGFYAKAGDSKGNGTIGIGSGNGVIVAPGADTGAKQYEISYKHVFSKRTAAWLGYVKLDNDNNALYSLGGLHTPTKAGENQSAWVFRVEHRF